MMRMYTDDQHIMAVGYDVDTLVALKQSIVAHESFKDVCVDDLDHVAFLISSAQKEDIRYVVCCVRFSYRGATYIKTWQPCEAVHHGRIEKIHATGGEMQD